MKICLTRNLFHKYISDHIFIYSICFTPHCSATQSKSKGGHFIIISIWPIHNDWVLLYTLWFVDISYCVLNHMDDGFGLLGFFECLCNYWRTGCSSVIFMENIYIFFLDRHPLLVSYTCFITPEANVIKLLGYMECFVSFVVFFNYFSKTEEMSRPLVELVFVILVLFHFVTTGFTFMWKQLLQHNEPPGVSVRIVCLRK